ncbi:MAG TPA: Ig-like domain-containing protein [Steroidobacteraceae bacterium]|jgi:hypothetical protein|nr:Ig-like domain-containing protein [Steroidobacteraceae bacterium]
MNKVAPLALAVSSVLMALSAQGQAIDTTTSLSANTDTANILGFSDSSVVFTATVTDGGNPVTGVVSFLNASTDTVLSGGGAASLSNGLATFVTGFSTPGIYEIEAEYLGRAGFAPSTSSEFTLTVVNPKAPPPASAPEIDPGSMASAVTLLLGGLTALRGRKRA